ncbi:Glutaredoxin [Macrophomina phaseolina MS6]|uniref:Glutaredoxin n=1 Tax=Macrophomina phaseolina (strain MS6) TaxID=1126212 RepID=K2SY95_MACPH|nr:Glutaredoxin [Macrophomina phaseolina MS6]
MAPSNMLTRSAATKASRTRFTDPETVVHTSKMFKKHTQRSTNPRSKAVPPSKYALTSKPHGILKSHSRAQASPSAAGREKRQRQLEGPLSGLFIETSKSYRTTLIATAETALSATRRALLSRLVATNGPASPSHPAAHDHEATRSPSTRLPTTAELQTAHNALVARLTTPFGRETLTHSDEDGALWLPGSGSDNTTTTVTTLAATMDDFAVVVAREEKKLKALEEEWAQVVAEKKALMASFATMMDQD